METKNRKISINKKSLALTIAVSLSLILCISFAVQIYFPLVSNSMTIASHNEFHCWIEHFRNGKLLSATYHAMTITNFGKNQTRDLLGGVNTYSMLYLGCSNDASAADAAWTELPSEITANGLARALGSYVLDDTGNGKWNVTYTWTASGTQSTRMYGVYSRSYAAGQTTLCYVEQQGAGAVKNLLADDTLKMTVQGTSS
jgi:hypothetical protein